MGQTYYPRPAQRLRQWAAVVAAGAVLLGSGAALAQDAANYPNKPIRIIVPYPAGGATDIVGRLIGNKLTADWHQPTVVDNKAGAGGTIGNAEAAKAPADGYTVLVGITAIIQAPGMYQNLRYDVFKDFTPISEIARSGDLFVVTPDVPANSLKEFVALAKANPEKYAYGSYGNGTSSHIHGEMFNDQAGLKLQHVPYKGAAPMLNDLLGGQLKTAFLDIATARAHLGSGKFKVLATTGAQRLKATPDVPTFTELGYKDFEPFGWFGVFVPAATPKPVVDKLAAEVVKIVQMPDVRQRLEELSLMPVGSTPAQFAATMRADSPKWLKAIKDADIKLE